MFLQWCGDVLPKVYIFVQRLPTRTVAASEAHHCANTNVVANWVGSVDSEEQADKISIDKTKM
jgi:hypothetical protein